LFDLIRQFKTLPESRELLTSLLEHNPTWLVPERRLKKFIKRQVSNHFDSAGADDVAALSSVASKSPGKRFLKLFSIGSSNTHKTSQVQIPEAAPVKPESKLQTPEPEPTEPPVEDPVHEEPQVQVRSVEAAYASDDNDGKKDDCNCRSGQACTIM
jgi:hypothetical protein